MIEKITNKKQANPKERILNDLLKPWINEISLTREIAYPLIFHWSGVDNHQLNALIKINAQPIKKRLFPPLWLFSITDCSSSLLAPNIFINGQNKEYAKSKMWVLLRR
jgi:hypothetical protein